jgi:hypothetical protein
VTRRQLAALTVAYVVVCAAWTVLAVLALHQLGIGS